MSRSRRNPAPPVPGAQLLKAAASSLQPDVWRLDGRRVWKTYRESAPWLRATICRWMTRREWRNLRLLAGMRGVPRPLGLPEPWTIEMSWLDAEPLASEKKGHDVTPEYFDQLWEMLLEIHRRNLNHGDLRRKNLLRDTETRQPVLIDFTQSMHSSSGKSLFHRLVLHRAMNVDRLTFLKLKRWYLGPEALPLEERAELDRLPLHMKIGHFLRKKIYRPFKHWRTGKSKRKRA